MANSEKKFEPFGIGHVPYRVRCALQFVMRFYRWFQGQHPETSQETEILPLLIWEDRDVEGTFDFDFPGRLNVNLVMECRNEANQVRWVPTRIEEEYGKEKIKHVWEGEELALICSAFPKM